MGKRNRKKVRKAIRLLDEADAALGDLTDNIANLQHELNEAWMRFNLQYLTIQEKLQSESRRHAAISNVMKTKHETVKNVLNNVR